MGERSRACSTVRRQSSPAVARSSINIHGGPNDARERPRFQGRSAYFLNEMGIAIVYPNVRGSFGFGRTFEQLDDGRKREDAVKDVGALLDWIAQQPSLDASRVMVTGASYGGYMTYAVAAPLSGADPMRLCRGRDLELRHLPRDTRKPAVSRTGAPSTATSRTRRCAASSPRCHR